MMLQSGRLARKQARLIRCSHTTCPHPQGPCASHRSRLSLALAAELIAQWSSVRDSHTQDPLIFHRIRFSFAHPDLPPVGAGAGASQQLDEPEVICAFLREYGQQIFGSGALNLGSESGSARSGSSRSSSSSETSSGREEESSGSSDGGSSSVAMSERGQFGCIKKVGPKVCGIPAEGTFQVAASVYYWQITPVPREL